jgi:hypothetical protein
MLRWAKAARWLFLAVFPVASCGGITSSPKDAGPEAAADATQSGGEDAAEDVGVDAVAALDSTAPVMDATMMTDAPDSATPVDDAEASAPCIPRPSGVVSWWRAEGNFDDSAGTNNGVSAGAGDVAFAPGEIGMGWKLAGTANSYVLVPDSPTLELTSAITIDAWINPTVLGGRIVDKITAGGADGYMLDTYAGYLRFIVGNASLSSTSPLTTGTFTHVAAVYDGSHMTVYIDGIAAGTMVTAVAAIPTNLLQLRMGADSSGGSLFTGIIDEVRIFGRALSLGEIQAIAQQGSAPRCP